MLQDDYKYVGQDANTSTSRLVRTATCIEPDCGRRCSKRAHRYTKLQYALRLMPIVDDCECHNHNM